MTHRTHSLPSLIEEPSAPFLIYIQHRDKTQDKHWRPHALLILTKALRTSGFLSLLPPEDLRNFLLLLTFLTPNGSCTPTLLQLHEAMGVSQAKARAKMQRLTEFQWQDKPLVIAFQQGDGQDAFAPAPGLIPVAEEPIEQGNTAAQPPLIAAPREAVIAYSRAHYARPRAEVEAMIEQQFRHTAPGGTTTPSTGEDPATTELRQKLENWGVTGEQAQHLIEQFEPERIERQLEWLPYREAHNPPGLLIAAIEGDYEPPFALRQFWARQALEEQRRNALAPDKPQPEEQRSTEMEGADQFVDNQSEVEQQLEDEQLEQILKGKEWLAEPDGVEEHANTEANDTEVT